MAKKLYLCLVFFCIFWLVAVPSITGDNIAHAAVHETDPFVYISTDVTNQQGQNCTETFRVNINTPKQTITQIKCPLGTIIATMLVHRSEAIAMHKNFVALPKTQNEEQQTLQHIKQLSTRPLLSSTAIHPAVACGNQGTASLTWSGDLFSTVEYYKSLDCTHVTIEQASIRASEGGGGSYWAYDLYAGNQYNVPGCPFVTNGGYYSHGVNQVAATGYYYENWMKEYFYCSVFLEY